MRYQSSMFQIPFLLFGTQENIEVNVIVIITIPHQVFIHFFRLNSSALREKVIGIVLHAIPGAFHHLTSSKVIHFSTWSALYIWLQFTETKSLNLFDTLF